MVQLAVRVSQFYEHESCGKCTPCRVGTKWLTTILQKIEDGRGTQADMDLLVSVAERINGKCLCPLGDSDAIAVMSYFDKFRDEFQAHIDEGGCPFHGDLVARPAARPRRHARPRRRARSGARMTRPRQGQDRRPRGRGAEGHRARRDRGGGRDRDPRLLLRAAARAAGRRLPHVPRRGRGAAEAPGRLRAHRAGRHGRARPRPPRRRRPRARTRRSSSSSSTTRSTAPSATRAASARCRT